MFSLIDDFISLIFPKLCCACGRPLVKGEEFVCLNCIISIPRTNYHTIPNNPVEKLFWGRCQIEKASTFSFFSQDGKMRQLIHNLKYNGLDALGIQMGKIYGDELKKTAFFNDIDLLIPVPLHKRKMRSRGYNQSMKIAEGLSLSSGIPINDNILFRKSYRNTQTQKGRFERWQNAKDSYFVKNYEDISNKHILLVDDVITTGSTIESSATELLKGENVRVSVVALAITKIW